MTILSIIPRTILAVAITASLVAGCDRRNASTPPPKSSNVGTTLTAPPPAGQGAETPTGQGAHRGYFIRIANDPSNEKPSHADQVGKQIRPQIY